MTILLTMREDIHGTKGENLDSISKNWIFLLKEQHVNFLLCPNLLSISKTFIENYNISKIILTGGGEVLEDFSEDESKRQSVENYLIQTSISKNIPLFGVCRGMQVINNYFGGVKKKIQGHSGTNHSISILKRKKIVKNYFVNSFHDEGIVLEGLAKDLEAVAFSEEKLVEALRHKKLSIFGQMWHPERKTLDERSNEYFFDFLNNNFK